MKHARIEESINYIKKYIGLPYIWGGNNPLEGFDCSGYVLEYLRALGINISDRTAQEIFNYLYEKNYISGLRRGSILFFGKDRENITHCSIALNNLQHIEAGGGDSRTNTLEDAIKQNAFVRIRKIRKDIIAAIMPI